MEAKVQPEPLAVRGHTVEVGSNLPNPRPSARKTLRHGNIGLIRLWALGPNNQIRMKAKRAVGSRDRINKQMWPRSDGIFGQISIREAQRTQANKLPAWSPMEDYMNNRIIDNHYTEPYAFLYAQKGFVICILAPSYGCGGFLTGRTGVISSPNFPQLYPNNAFCSWEIRVPPNKQVELTFLHIDLEIATNCVYDSVTIYDGIPLSSQTMRKVCTPVNETFTSSTNVMGIVFTSDYSVQRSGFQIAYTTVDRNSQEVNCGGILTNYWGTIESPFYPYSHRRAHCSWHIQVSSDHVIQLYFTDSALGNCGMGYVSVYDGTPYNSPLLGSFCGSTTQSFLSSSNSLSVIYTSNGSNNSFVRGFHAYYYAQYQSSQNVTLSCSTDYMTARISVSYLQSIGYSPYELSLNDPQCRPTNYGDWLVFEIFYNQCGTMTQGGGDTINYINTVYGFHSGQVIQRSKKLKLNLQCLLYQNTMVEIMYEVDDTLQRNVNQYGLYSASLSLYSSPNYYYPVYQWPYYARLNQNLYFQATLHSSDPDLTLFVDTCVASPNQMDFVSQTYDLIRNGCIKDSTYAVYPRPSYNIVRFGFSTFGFASRYSSVYLQCKLTVCRRYDYYSRCTRGCITRRRRAAEASHGSSETLIIGPIEVQGN
ncbi:hypothetical protein XELAEV_18029075mg [Xenopus laevis]|uniref:Deleted in malignant brain tumors 1 protein n=1 Tax=Xenopus laevis TaxID=8355 RepID=A0A974CR10_XENLA|nr:hypothetical protein XELAEV_18029075mg [Xenopus laevis]